MNTYSSRPPKQIRDLTGHLSISYLTSP